MILEAVIVEEEVRHVLAGLLGQTISLSHCNAVDLHPQTRRGLLTDNNALVGVIGGDLAFAHNAGAALAMVPKAQVEAAGTTPDEELMEFYIEVANVLSRLVNEAGPTHIRIDPGLEISGELFDGAIARSSLHAHTVDIDGYGPGNVGFWLL